MAKITKNGDQNVRFSFSKVEIASASSIFEAFVVETVAEVKAPFRHIPDAMMVIGTKSIHVGSREEVAKMMEATQAPCSTHAYIVLNAVKDVSHLDVMTAFFMQHMDRVYEIMVTMVMMLRLSEQDDVDDLTMEAITAAINNGFLPELRAMIDDYLTR